MSLFKELTEGQCKSLFDLVNHQIKVNKDVRFFAREVQTQYHIIDIEYYSDRSYPPIVKIPNEFLETWEDNDYITISNRKYAIGGNQGETVFVLRKEAFDYADFMKKSPFQRWMITLGHNLFDHIDSLVWPIIVTTITTVITTVITYFILRGLGANP